MVQMEPLHPGGTHRGALRAPEGGELLLAHLREGSFALIHGDPGSGKSVVMRLLAERLSRLADLSVGVIHHPQSNLGDFYRELGDIFSLSMRVNNRWGGFKALRACSTNCAARNSSPWARASARDWPPGLPVAMNSWLAWISYWPRPAMPPS